MTPSQHPKTCFCLANKDFQKTAGTSRSQEAELAAENPQKKANFFLHDHFSVVDFRCCSGFGVLPGLVGQRIGGQMERLWVFPIRGYKSGWLVIERKRTMKLRSLGILAAVAAAVIGGLSAASARAATITLYASEDGFNGGALTTLATANTLGSSVSFTGTFGDFTINTLGGSSINTAGFSDLLSSTTSVTNNTGTQHTLHLWLSQDGFTLPNGGPFTLSSSLGGTAPAQGLTLSNIFQAWYDQNNGQRTTPATTNGPQTATFDSGGQSFGTGTAAGTYPHVDGNLYSLTSVTNFQLNGGSTANYSNSAIVTAVPVPAAAWTGLSTLAGLAGMGIIRRRRSA